MAWCLTALFGIQMSHAQQATPSGINNPTGIKLNKTSLTLDVGEIEKLSASVQPGNAPQDVEWDVESGSNVVSVTSSGVVTAKAVGTAVITVMSAVDNSVSETCSVTVKKSADTDVSKLDNVIYLEKTEIHSGTTATLSLQMKNTAAICGFQFDLYLPQGVTAVKNANGRIKPALSDGRRAEDDKHTLTAEEQADGAIRFLCGSQYNETFTGKDGEILTLQISLSEDMADGDYPVFLKNMRLSEMDIDKYYDTERVKTTLTVSSYIIGDINGDGTVNVSDYIGIANHILGMTPAGFIEKAADVNGDNIVNVSDYIGVANIILTGSPYGKSNKPAYLRGKNTDLSKIENVIYVAPTTVDAGTQTTLSFKMKNSADIRGFQFDLYLPEGVTAVKKANGRIDAELNQGRKPEDDAYTLTLQEQADGAIRFLCGSQYDETFTGNEGEIATLKVDIKAEMAKGDYSVYLRNMRLTETDISKYYDSDVIESIITIGADGIEDLLGDDNAPAFLYNLSGQQLTKPQHGINIIYRPEGTSKKVLVK